MGSSLPGASFPDIQVVPGLPFIYSLFVGGWQNFALDEHKQAWAWGCNAQHRLGLPGQDNVFQPVRIPEYHFENITAGRFHTFAVDDKGSLLVFGDNNTQAKLPHEIIHPLATLSIRSRWAATKKSA